jgi:hypothetical protein
MGKIRNYYHVLIGRPLRNRTFRRPSHKWENNIKMYLKGIGCEVMD